MGKTFVVEFIDYIPGVYMCSVNYIDIKIIIHL